MNLSIIIPVYNAEKTIRRLVESVIKTTNPRIEYEIILINDGSLDSSLECCLALKEEYSNIHVISQENAGPSAARNRGIEVAKGKHLLFLDSDDYISDNSLNILSSHFNKDLVIFGVYDEIWDGENLISVTNYEPKEKEYSSAIDLLKDFHYLLENNLLYSQCTKMYKNEIIKNNNLKFNESLSMGEDVSFNLEYFQYINDAKIINESLYHYTHLLSSNSICSNYYPGYFENVCFINQKKLQLLSNWEVLDETNKNSLESFFIGKISSAMQNEMSNKCSIIQKYKNVKKIILSDEAKKAVIVGTPKKALHKLLSVCIKMRSPMLAVCLYKGVSIIKMHIMPIIYRGR